MALPLISQRPPPNVDPTKASLAFADRALPKLNRELKDENLLTKQRALLSLADYLHDPEHVAEALQIGIIVSLKNLLSDSDDFVRFQSLEVLYILSCSAYGRNAFIECGIIEAISQLFHDENNGVRRNAHRAIATLCESPIGAQAVVDAKLVSTLVSKLSEEHDEIKILLLDSIHFCSRQNPLDALEASAMETLTSLLSHEYYVIRGKAVRDISDLSVDLEGKNRALSCGCVAKLVELLADENEMVRAGSAGALMFITITTKGKYQALECGAIEALLNLLNDSKSEVRLNVVKAITCLGETPEGRKKLMAEIHKFEPLRQDSSLSVQIAVDIAIKVITWTP